MPVLAINGGEPLRKRPFASWPKYDEREKKLLNEVLESRNWGGFPAPNKKARELAERFAAYCGTRFAICCSNGSVSLEMALKAGGVKAGDEVIVPALTWVATAGCAVHINAVPVFVDIDPETYCIDVNKIEEAITDKTKAIIPVHLGASVADMDGIIDIAARHGLLVIEDCAHAHGAEWRGKRVGSIGHFGSFSFQSSKLLTAGEGGMITTSNPLYAMKCHSLANCGRKEEGYNEFDGWLFGWNNRMSELHAAILLAQMERYDEVTEKRAEMAKYLCERLASEVEGLTPLKRDPRQTRQTFYQLILKYDQRYFKGLHRDRFISALEAEGVEFDGPFYVPIYQSPLFNVTADEWPMIRQRYGNDIWSAGISCPVAEKAAYNESVWMHYHYLDGTMEDIDDIITAIKKVQDNVKELL